MVGFFTKHNMLWIVDVSKEKRTARGTVNVAPYGVYPREDRNRLPLEVIPPSSGGNVTAGDKRGPLRGEREAPA